MRKLFTRLCCVLFVVAPLFAEVASASDETKDDDRLRNSRTVLGEDSRNLELFTGTRLVRRSLPRGFHDPTGQ